MGGGVGAPTTTPPPVAAEVVGAAFEPAPLTPLLPASMQEAAARLTEAATGSTTAWDRLAFMCDTFGHRLSGSKALEDAIDWAVDTLKADGMSNVRREKVMVPKWVRGRERARVLSPVRRDLSILGLGGTVGTAGIRAEVAVVQTLADIAKEGEALRGKIIVINQPMPTYDHEHRDPGYGQTVKIRWSGAVEGAKVGAKAVLIRSVTAHSLGAPHTGSMGYDDAHKKIPTAALSVEDAEYLARAVKRGPVKLELKLGARSFPDVESANVVAELPGRERPGEVVLIGAHIDSWDVGQGAHDDGSGVLMAMDAARMLKQLGLIPRRTIRVVLFTNEENGLRGGTAYFEAHKGDNHVAAIEADTGSGAPQGFGVVGGPENAAALSVFAPLFEGLGASAIRQGRGGADIGPLTRAGVLSLSVAPDTSHYFDYHHSAADTVDKVNPDYLQRNAAAMALMAYVLAERE